MLSIIIPAHDEAALIGATLAALRTAAETLYLDNEIRVVDDASTDAIAEIAAMDGGAVGGGCRVGLAGHVRWRERMLSAVLVLVQLLRWLKIALGCFMFCTRTAFDAVGGLELRRYAGEDVAMSRAMAAHSRFVLLRETVLTSDRKLRTFTAREHLRLLWRFMRGGRSILRSRDALAIWYDRRDVE